MPESPLKWAYSVKQPKERHMNWSAEKDLVTIVQKTNFFLASTLAMKRKSPLELR